MANIVSNIDKDFLRPHKHKGVGDGNNKIFIGSVSTCMAKNSADYTLTSLTSIM